MKVIDLSGYSFSGKSAVYDLLNEFDGYKGLGKEFEFDLIRVSGGVLDLKTALVDLWSPVRSSEAIRRFEKLIDNLGGNGSGFARLMKLGTHYELLFPGFERNSRDYLEDLCDAQWSSSWPFAYFEAGKLEIFSRKFLSRIFARDTMRSKVFLSRPGAERFLSATRKYLQALLRTHEISGCRALLLNNAFEPFTPENAVGLFDDAYCIVVDRDPRDIYLSAMRAGSVGNADIGQAVRGETVDDFIARFRLYRTGDIEDNRRVLRLRFESLVEDYETAVATILRFLGESPEVHVGKRTKFKPEISCRTIGQWYEATAQELKAVRRIEQQLPAYCR